MSDLLYAKGNELCDHPFVLFIKITHFPLLLLTIFVEVLCKNVSCVLSLRVYPGHRKPNQAPKM